MDTLATVSSAHVSDVSIATSPTTEQTLSALAIAIRTGVEYAEKHAKRAVDSARTVGQNLLLAKQQVEHGAWETWVTQNTPLKPRTAQAYMKLAVRMDELEPEKAQRVALLPIREALKAIAPAENMHGYVWPRTQASNTGQVELSAFEDEDHDRGFRQAWAANVRKTIAGLERFAKAIEDGKSVSRSTLAKLSRELDAALKTVHDLRHVDAHHRDDVGATEDGAADG